MTCCYGLFVVVLWLSIALAVPAALGLFIEIFVAIPKQDYVLIGILAGVGGLLVVWTLLMRLRSQQVRIRAGAWPALFCDDIVPTVGGTGEEFEALRASVRQCRQKTGRVPTVVGASWGYFLKRRGPSGPRIFMHNFAGKIGNNRWAAGTTIADVQKALLKKPSFKNEEGKEVGKGWSLESTPTMADISLGSWFSHANHGAQKCSHLKPFVCT